MTDSVENPFGITLLREKLRAPMVPGSVATQSRLSLQEPHLDPRGIGTDGRPTAVDRGLAQYAGPRPTLRVNDGYRSESNTLSSPATFLRELSALQVQGMFAMKKPANVNARDLRENDSTFRGRGAVMATFVSKTARRFGVRPGLLAEHLVAEDAFADLAPVPANASLTEYLKVKTTTTSQLGLDDFVSHRKTIEKAVPAAAAISHGRPSNPIVAESEIRKALERGATQEEIGRLSKKPQLELPLGDGIAAAAAYLKYKAGLAKERISDFDALPTEIQFQLTRLFVNPPSGEKNPKGINYIIREANAGRYMNLFDFSDRTAHEANDPSKSMDIYRRATIHTARAIHLDQEILDQ